MPYVIPGPLLAVGMQIGYRGVVQVTQEGIPGFPLHQDEHLARNDIALLRLTETTQCQHSANVGRHLARLLEKAHCCRSALHRGPVNGSANLEPDSR